MRLYTIREIYCAAHKLFANMTTRLLTVTPLLSKIVTHLNLSTGKGMLLFVKSAAIGVARSFQWIAMTAILLTAVLGNNGVALTAPYMHDGSIATLEEVIAHY